MQVSCLKRKPNMVESAQEDTPEVGGRYLNIQVIHIQTQQTVSTRCRVLGLAKS